MEVLGFHHRGWEVRKGEGVDRVYRLVQCNSVKPQRIARRSD